MIKKIHVLFKVIDEHFGLPSGTAKIEIKNRMNISSIKYLNYDDLSYLLRYLDNILLENGIDIEK